MSAIPMGSQSKPGGRRFWHELAERLDALVAYPAKHAISEQELRRVDDGIKRCRQLMFQKQQRKRDVTLARVTVARDARSRGR
ncbi:MAG TPA: hypothetical protein VMF32_16745 [Xanthobacteraceae bacterium]|nr:hypothetical protein [Xanthobacteraceae bacterium]